MGILDRFRKKKIKKEKREIPEKKVKEVREPEIPPEEKRIERKGIPLHAYRILKSLHITEKATDLTKKNQYVFKVYSRSNKIEIKRVIEGLYGVKVVDVKIIKIPQKRRRLGRITGWRKGYKKAIVKIKEGQKIEVLPR